MRNKKIESKNASMKFRAELFILLALACLSCSKAPVIKPEPVAVELCEAWGARQNISQATFEGRLDISGGRTSGNWDVIASVEQPAKIKMLLFEPFFGIESGRLESTKKGVKFVYGRTKFKIKMPPEILVQALLAKPDCSRIQADRKNLRYELVFEDGILSSWTAWKNLTIICKFNYIEGFEEKGSSVRPRAVEFFWVLDEGVRGMLRLTH